MSNTPLPECKMAPVQGWPQGIPWSLHLEAYAAYSKKWAPQPALIDLEGRNCRGGFSTGELDEFIPGWREKVSEITALREQLDHAAAVSAAKDAEIAGLRERLQKMSDTMKGMDAHEAGLAEAQAYLMERVRVLEDALQAASDAILHIRDMHWTHWTAREQQEAGDAAFAARAALGDNVPTTPPLSPSPRS